MSLKAPFILMAVAGVASVASAQMGTPKDQTSNAMGDIKVLKSQQIVLGGFSNRVDASDNCGDAPAVVDGDVVSYDLTSASNDFAGSCGLSGASADTWVKVTATVDSRCTFATCGLAGSDTVLLATDGCGGGELICNDDSCGLQSRIAFNLDAGQTAYVRIAGYNANTHAGQMSVAVTPRVVGGPGATDDCASAPATTNGGVYDYDLANATNDYAGSCGGTGTAADMYLKYTTGANSEQLTASTCDLVSADSVLSILDGCGGSELACVDDACGLQSTAVAVIPANTTVYVRIAGYAGNIHAGQVSIATIPVTPPSNDSCASAESLTVGTPASFDTSFADSDGAASCGFGGNPGTNDVYFKFTADRDGAVEVFTCDGTAFDTIVSMTEGCGGSEVGCNDDSCGLLSYFLANVTNGTEYVVRISGYAGARGAGTLTVNYAEPCVLSQPSGSTVEPEDCGSDANGGCNNAEFLVTAATVDSTYYGTAWADANFRDTDWYEFTIGEQRDLTVSGHAAFPLRLFILDNLCPPTIIATVASTRPCQDVEVTANLLPGTYRVFAGVDGFAGYPCDGATDNHYVLNIGNPGSGCIADFNNDSFVDFFDYADYVLCFEEGTCPAGRTADINGDDFVDFFDYADYVTEFERGC